MNDTSPVVLFDKFRIIDTLKKDMHTGVYLAYHIYLDKEIILKTLNTESAQDKNILERFKREARILAHLDHPNIIKVLDFGTYDKFFYISFEYFTGSNLREAISGGSLSEESRQFILRQLFQGLEAAHQHDIIHRDLKPENILINSNYEIKIADFGLAQSAREDIATNKYGIVGTPGYMSPEQIRGESLTTQSDLFSAGIIAYELYTGCNPFLGKDLNETINNILKFRESSVAEKITGLPEEIRAIINNLLQKSKASRAKSAAEVIKLFRPDKKNNYTEVNTALHTDIPANIPDENTASAASVQATSERSPIHKQKRNFLLNRYTYTIAAVIIISAAIFFYVFSGQKQNGMQNMHTAHDSIPANIKNTQMTVLPEKDSVKAPEKKNNEEVLKASDKQQEKQAKQEQMADAKILNEKTPEKEVRTNTTGKLMVSCQPWAEVYIDSFKVDTTPLSSYIILKAGRHHLVLKNPGYPQYSQIINIQPGGTELVNVNFKTTVGYLECNIHPWGDLYIDGIFRGQTPLTAPIALMPGKHRLMVKNPSFADRHEDITIKKGESFYFNYTFGK